MRSKLALAVMMACSTAPAILPTAAVARSHRHYQRNYHGRSSYHRHPCGGGNGAVGTVAGGIGGALLGNALGGGTLGTIAGGVGGGLLGRHFDKTHSRHVNGC